MKYRATIHLKISLDILRKKAYNYYGIHSSTTEVGAVFRAHGDRAIITITNGVTTIEVNVPGKLERSSMPKFIELFYQEIGKTGWETDKNGQPRPNS